MNCLKLTRDEKILISRDYRRVMNKGVKYVGPSLVIIGVPAIQRRVGIIASKKVGGAVVRNKVKRRLRECYRNTPLLLTPTRESQWHQRSWPAMEFVIIARKSATDAPMHQLSSELIKAMIGLQKRLAYSAPAQHRSTSSTHCRTSSLSRPSAPPALHEPGSRVLSN